MQSCTHLTGRPATYSCIVQQLPNQMPDSKTFVCDKCPNQSENIAAAATLSSKGDAENEPKIPQARCTIKATSSVCNHCQSSPNLISLAELINNGITHCRPSNCLMQNLVNKAQSVQNCSHMCQNSSSNCCMSGSCCAKSCYHGCCRFHGANVIRSNQCCCCNRPECIICQTRLKMLTIRSMDVPCSKSIHPSNNCCSGLCCHQAALLQSQGCHHCPLSLSCQSLQDCMFI